MTACENKGIMQAMTPEQTKRWQKAINPLDYLDFQALSEDGLTASARRFKGGRGVPGWAIQVRSVCIIEAWNDQEAWVPGFALRSEVALLGLKILYPKQEERVEVYRRLLVNFLSRVLIPLQYDCMPLRGVRQLCKQGQVPEPVWDDEQRSIYTRRTTHNDVDLLQLAFQSILFVKLCHFRPPDEWWLKGGLELASNLAWSYKSQFKQGKILDNSIQRDTLEARSGAYKPIADAFLLTLEAECPPPE